MLFLSSPTTQAWCQLAKRCTHVRILLAPRDDHTEGGPHPNHVARCQRRLGHALAVQMGAVGAAQITQHAERPVAHQLRVATGSLVATENHVAVLVAAERQARLCQRQRRAPGLGEEPFHRQTPG